VVPGINDSVAAMAEVAEMVSTLSAVERTCLLPFHDTGRGKRRALGARPGFEVAQQRDEIEPLLEPFFDHVLEVQIGG
jgi:pyruvate-formate lyase-activating enzyme